MNATFELLRLLLVSFNCPPDRLGLEHIRIFQAHLFSDRKFSPNTVNQHLAALRFFFVKTLRRPWNTADTPYPKRVKRLPKVLSRDEVALLIDSAVIPFHQSDSDDALRYRNTPGRIGTFAGQRY